MAYSIRLRSALFACATLLLSCLVALLALILPGAASQFLVVSRLAALDVGGLGIGLGYVNARSLRPPVEYKPFLFLAQGEIGHLHRGMGCWAGVFFIDCWMKPVPERSYNHFASQAGAKNPQHEGLVENEGIPLAGCVLGVLIGIHLFLQLIVIFNLGLLVTLAIVCETSMMMFCERVKGIGCVI